MDDDKTVFRPIRRDPASGFSACADLCGICATWRLPNGATKNLRIFARSVIGRDPSCAVHLDDSEVSRHHAEVFYENAFWHIRDLDSANGTFLNGKQINQEKIEGKVQVGVGAQEPNLWLETEVEVPVKPGPDIPVKPEPAQVIPNSATQFLSRYFDDKGAGGDSDQSKIVREAFRRIAKKKTRKYRGILVVAILLLGLVSGFGFYEYKKLEKLRASATSIFYTMKTLEVQLAKQELAAEQSENSQDQTDLDAKRQKLVALEHEYDQYVEQTDLFGITLSEQDKLIYKIARLFGECELNMPPSFVREVKHYIKKWKSTPSLERSIARAQAHGFLPVVQRAMTKHDLPLQFFYLGLRESGFQIQAIGPETRFGIAKGPWQFIPSTAVRYGMNTGPLVDQREFDPGDERFDPYKSTYAAARYLKDIYATKAQASGLLVMASYNWGEANINRLLDQMPENPAERNFWELINRFTIPDETYQYVLYIFSAAVIGENPKLFGFDFDDPLAGLGNPLPP